MQFDKWILRILPIAFIGTLLAVYVRHQDSVSFAVRPPPEEAGARATQAQDPEKWVELEQRRGTARGGQAGKQQENGGGGQPPADLREEIRRITGATLPDPSQASAKMLGGSVNLGIGEMKLLLSRGGSGETVEALLYGGEPIEPGGAIVILTRDEDRWSSLMLALYRDTAGILVIRTSPQEKLRKRVQDALIAVAYLSSRPKIRSVDLVGLGGEGPTCLLARGLCGGAVRRTYAENAAFSFASVTDPNDPRYLPEAVRYGDLPRFATAAAPGELFLGSAKGLDAAPLRKAYGGSSALRIEEGWVPHSVVTQWLTR